MSILDGVLSFFRRFTVQAAGARIDSYGSAAGETVDENDVLNLSTAWACVRLIAGTTASLPLDVKQEVEGGHKVVLKDHPLYRLLRRAPNAEQTALDFWEGGVASIELKGNMVALKRFGVSGSVIALEPMAWDWVNVRRRESDDALVYEYKGEKYTSRDVLHIRGFGGSPEGGLSTIAMGAETFGVAKAVNKAAGKTFKNGVRASGAFVSDKPLTPEQMDAAERRVTEKYAGAMNAGRPLLLNNGMKWEQITINPEDAQMLESRAFSVEEVCRMFNVPPHMVGHTEKSTSWGTGLSEQTLGFVKFNLRTRLKRIETALEQQLLTPEDITKGISIEFNLEGLLRGDTKSRLESYERGLRNGIYTINEVRALEGLPPVEGGGVPRMQMQNVPITYEPDEGQGGSPALPPPA